MNKFYIYPLILISFFILIESPSFIRDNLISEYIQLDTTSIYDNNSPLVSKPHPSDIQPAVISTKQGPAVIDIEFNEHISHAGLSLYFYGIFQQANSFYPKSFEIYNISPSGDDELLDQVSSHKSNNYQLKLSKNIESSGIKIKINNAKYNDVVIVGDLKIYQKNSVPITQGLSNFLGSMNKSIFAYFASIFIFVILLYISGYFPAKHIYSWIDISTDINMKYIFILGLAPIITFFLLSITSLSYIFLNIDFPPYIFISYTVISLIVFIYKKEYRFIKYAKEVVIITGVAALITTLLQVNRDFIFNLPYIENN